MLVQPKEAATVAELLALPDDTQYIRYTGAHDIQIDELDQILARFHRLRRLTLQDGSGIILLLQASLPPSMHGSLMRLALKDGRMRLELKHGAHTLYLAGFTDLAELPAGIWSAKNPNSVPELSVAGLDVGQLLSNHDDLSKVEVLEVRQCNHLPGDVVSKLVGLRHLAIRDCHHLDLPEELVDLTALQRLDLCRSWRHKDLPPCVWALSGLRHLHLEILPSLRALPATLSGLGRLACLEVEMCDITMPEGISDLKQLEALSISNCPRVTTLPTSISALVKLTSLSMHSVPLAELPHEIGLLELRHLQLLGCDRLVELPSSIGRLDRLWSLGLAFCSALITLPGSISELIALDSLDLSCCSRLERLPSGIGQLDRLQKLDLRFCGSLRRLPASVRQLTRLKHVSIYGCRSLLAAPPQLVAAADLANLTEEQRKVLPSSARWDGFWVKAGRWLRCIKRKEWTPAELLGLVAGDGAHQAIISKLVREQQAMLTTLERLSWLVVLLATATFMAYMSPPGGFNASTQLVMADELPCSLQLPGRRGTGNYTQEQMDFRRCAAATFFVLDGLSFGLSLGCVMVITLLSFPRLLYASDKVEAGRFWFALLVTWAMFYSAVLTGFMAFLFSGLATYNQIRVVLVPAVPGMLTMLVAFIVFGRRFSSINPGWDAVKCWFLVLLTGADLKEPDDDEGTIGQLVGSGAFWDKLQRTLGAPTGGAPPAGLPGVPSSTLLPSAADSPYHGHPDTGASDPGQPALPRPPRSSSKQQLRRLRSSNVFRCRASAMAATSSYAGDVASSSVPRGTASVMAATSRHGDGSASRSAHAGSSSGGGGPGGSSGGGGSSNDEGGSRSSGGGGGGGSSGGGGGGSGGGGGGGSGSGRGSGSRSASPKDTTSGGRDQGTDLAEVKVE